MGTSFTPSPRISRSRSGGTLRICHVASPLSPNPGVRPMSRSRSTAKSRPSKENRVETVEGSCRKVVVSVTPSAWALSPGRYPAGAKGGGGGPMSGVLGFFRQKKEPSEREEMGHKLRIMAVRVMQWRFVNARAEAAMAAKAVAKNKIFFSWLKIAEQRNIVAAIRILIQRRKQKLRVIKTINPQLKLLNRWDLLAKAYLGAVSSLVKAFEARCLPIPLVEGAEVNLVMVHNYICTSMDLMLAIESAIREFYSKAELVKSLMCELVEVIRQELEGLIELRNTTRLITSLEMHEISLRTNLIQERKKQEAATNTIPVYGIMSTGVSRRNFNPTLSMFIY